MNDITMSVEQQMHYLIEHGQAIDSRFIDTVHTAYAEWLGLTDKML